MLDTVFRTSLLEPKMEMTNTINPHHGPRKDSTSYPAVLMKIKGELFHTNYQCYNKYRILILFNEIFALVIFKTEVVQISLQVFIFKFAMAIINLQSFPENRERQRKFLECLLFRDQSDAR